MTSYRDAKLIAASPASELNRSASEQVVPQPKCFCLLAQYSLIELSGVFGVHETSIPGAFMRHSITLQALLLTAAAWASSWPQPAAAQGLALAKDLLMEGKVTIWGWLYPDAQTVNLGGFTDVTFALRFTDKKVAEAADKLKGQRVRMVGNLKVTAKEPKLLQLEVSEIKPGQPEKVAPGDDPNSAYYKVEGEVVVRARLKKGDPKLKSDAALATPISRSTTIPIFFERESGELDGLFGGRHQAVLGKGKKELAKSAAALEDREVLVRASLRGHQFPSRSEYIAYIIQDIQVTD